MGFITALSGLNAASNNLSVTGNNIANANTTGFKRSRSEFADVYAASLGGVTATTPGSGVSVTNVAQLFNQGNLEFTGNNLDMAISGEGFFTLAQSPVDTNDISFTRAGEFKLDKDGFLVNNQGKALLVFKPNGPAISDGFSTGVTQPLQINTLTGLPTPTDRVELAVNLDADSVVIDPALLPFDVTDSNTFTTQTSATIFDSLGSPHILTTFFVKRPIPGGSNNPTWHLHHFMSDPGISTLTPITIGAPTGSIGNTDPLIAVPPADFGILSFDSGGKLVDPFDGKFNLDAFVITPPTGAANIDINTMNYFGSTQVQEKFSVNSLRQNGLPAGQLTGIDIDDEGVIFARFSNGGSQTQGKVALARFANVNGLDKLGDTAWGQSANSGEPIPGEAGSNNFGLVQSGALEASNVELAAQLVNLIVAQQAFQANAQTITTENAIVQSILNI